jgi:uncharacterized protein YbjQ (UPF0145 family)
MILTTTDVVEGQPAMEYLGLVVSEVILGANALKDMVSSVRDFIGGRVNTMEGALSEAREEALNNIAAEAEKLGANAIVGISIDYETLGQHGTMLMVCASGTAVTVNSGSIPDSDFHSGLKGGASRSVG